MFGSLKKSVEKLTGFVAVVMVFCTLSSSVLAVSHAKLYDDNVVLAAEQEGVEGFVTRLFQTCLGRQPDAGGLEYWTGELRKNILTGIGAAEYFFNSEEFKAKNLNDSGFLDILYTTLMGRQADTGGKEYWQGYLDNGSARSGVLRAFLNSVEFGNICLQYGITKGVAQPKENRDYNLNLTAFVFRLYTKVLGRNADADGLNFWTGNLIHNDWTAIQTALHSGYLR